MISAIQIAALGLAAIALTPAPAAAQAAPNGEMLFKQRCQACHTVVAGKAAPVGPNLYGVVNRKAASSSVPFNYSSALRASRLAWSRANLDKFLTAPMKLVPGTRMVMINSPNNPTGWTLTRAEQQAILGHCRRHGIWLVADDVYERLYYRDDAPAAPSFLDLAAPEERVIAINSFSKSWLMTGWRLGWMVAPSALMPDLGKLIEYNTSCSPAFVQRAGLAAITRGETTVAHTRARFHAARDFLVRELEQLPRIDVAAPAGAMYAFFKVDGLTDSLAFCKRLVHEAKLGLAPGSAFGPEGQGFVRWCFAADQVRLSDGVTRLARFLQR